MSAPKRGLPERRRMRHDRHFVDELTGRMGEGFGLMVPITSIRSNHDQPRSSLGDLSDLVDSIRRHGILEPLLVRRTEGRSEYELVSGERRFHAALEAGLHEVPCIELEVTDQHALEIALIENLQRKDLDPFEEAEGFQTLIEKYGYTHAQVAEAVGRSRVTVTEALRILRLPPPVRARCRHADIHAKGVLLELARIDDPGLLEEALQALEKGDLDRAALRLMRKDPEDGDGATTSSEEDGAAPEVAKASGQGARRPFVFRFRHPEEPVTISISFKGAEEQPEPGRLIHILEELLDDLRRQAAENDSPGTDS
ncbi:MAG: ParB/RepB/Spo0J family partition protein [Acidobacteria bacterium]|nr:ParB/RepB/Spo0J family partition protein [Acidobacteriota bacterium]